VASDPTVGDQNYMQPQYPPPAYIIRQGEDAPVSQAPSNLGSFAFMQQFEQPTSAPTAPQSVADEPFAMRAARVSATVPWQLEDSDLEWANANGLLDRAMVVPGRVA
jgi:hypothetical protein